MNAEHTLYEYFYEGETTNDVRRQRLMRKTHKQVQGKINAAGVDSVVDEFRRLAAAWTRRSPGSTVYADEYIDCITVPPGFIDRICRRAGVQTDAQRRLFNTYAHIIGNVSDSEPSLFEDVLVIDKDLVDGYES